VKIEAAVAALTVTAVETFASVMGVATAYGDGDGGQNRVATKVLCNKEGGSNGSKSDGDEGGGRATATATMWAMAMAMRLAGDKEGECKGGCHVIRDAYLYTHTSTWSTLVLTSSIYYWVRPYRPLLRKQRLHLIFDTNPRLGMIPKFFFKPCLRRNLTYSCNQNFYLLFECVKSFITRCFLLF
jgi:hypothetical protein